MQRRPEVIVRTITLRKISRRGPFKFSRGTADAGSVQVRGTRSVVSVPDV